MACPPRPSFMEPTKCPLCKSPVRIMRRGDGTADRYQFIGGKERHHVPNPIPPVLADYLRASRRGKRTGAIVGGAWSTGPWAPFGETEVWGLNNHHGIPWYKVDGITRWIDIHHKDYVRESSYNHWDWLQKEHPFPIYMQQKLDDVPSSVKYPLREIQKALIHNIYRGEEKMKKLFSSTMCYQIAQALYEGVERIELFGVELITKSEYEQQRESMAFWLGKADGMGVEVWMPEACALLVAPLYGYETSGPQRAERDYFDTQHRMWS